MLTFTDRTSPLYGLIIYFLVFPLNAAVAAVLYNLYLLIVLVMVGIKIMRFNSAVDNKTRSINTAAWGSSIAVMLITAWGLITIGNFYILAAGIIVVMGIENIRKQKLNKE